MFKKAIFSALLIASSLMAADGEKYWTEQQGRAHLYSTRDTMRAAPRHDWHKPRGTDMTLCTVYNKTDKDQEVVLHMSGRDGWGPLNEHIYKTIRAGGSYTITRGDMDQSLTSDVAAMDKVVMSPEELYISKDYKRVAEIKLGFNGAAIDILEGVKLEAHKD